MKGRRPSNVPGALWADRSGLHVPNSGQLPGGRLSRWNWPGPATGVKGFPRQRWLADPLSPCALTLRASDLLRHSFNSCVDAFFHGLLEFATDRGNQTVAGVRPRHSVPTPHDLGPLRAIDPPVG